MRTIAFIRSTTIRVTAIAALAVAPTVLAGDPLPVRGLLWCLPCRGCSRCAGNGKR